VEKITDFYKDWADNLANMQKAFGNFGAGERRESETAKKTHDLYEAWADMGQAGANSMRDAFEEMMKTFSKGAGRETLANIFSSAETYMKLFEFWLPVYKSLQEKTFDPASYKRLFDSAPYKEILDKVFDFVSPGAINEFYGQALKYLETITPMAQTFTKQFADLTQSGAKMYSGFLSGDLDAAAKTYENILETYRRGLSPMLKMPAMGKYREPIDLALNLLGKYPVLMAQYAKYQSLMHATGQKAMEKIIEQLARRMKENSAPPSYDEFFKIWAEVNEQAYNALFTAEELVTLQNELQNTGFAVKKDFQKLMELALANYPVVLRSEMDELYKIIHELKKKIHDLEKERRA